jgi:hypothetical protein
MVYTFWGGEQAKHMAKAIKIAVVMLILFALVASSMHSNVYAEEKTPVYADAFGEIIPPQLLVKVFNKTRLSPNTPDLSVYREFAKRFYKTCSVNVDMVLLLIYAIRVKYEGYPHDIGYALFYDPLTGNFLWGFLNRSEAATFFDWAYQDYYVASRGFPPAGFFFWYLVVDEDAWRVNHSLVVRAWFFRYNATHLKNPFTTYNGFPLDIYCPISDNFTWSMLFKGLPETVTMTYTLPITTTTTYTSPITITLPVTITETATTTLPITIASVVTTTTPITIEKTATVTSASLTTIKETVTHVETSTVERTATVSHTLTVPVTTTMSYTATLPVTIATTSVETVERTVTHVVKELDVVTALAVAGATLLLGLAMGLVVRRR